MMLRALCGAITLLSRIVPRQHRDKWQEEWRGELRGIARESGSGAARRFAGGMLRDAVAVRRVAVRSAPHDGKGAGHATMSISWMDFKLGFRMLLRSPGLTVVSVFGMAVAMGIVAGASTMISRQLDSTLPLPGGDRIVAVQAWDAAANAPEGRILHDFLLWRDELKSLEDVGAFRDLPRNVIIEGRVPELVTVAETTAAAFRVAAVPPLLGRYLSEEDERLPAPAVLVIGEAIWRDRFGANAEILGTSVRLNDTHYTIVGVMPDGFAFPVNHSWWIPMRVDAARVTRRQGPSIAVFARLAEGATMQTAQAEISGLGQRVSVAYPDTHQHLRPRVLPYTHPFSGVDDPGNAFGLRLVRFMLVLLLIVVSVNVAVLVYARTATRQGEIAIRTAIGASRGRIVSQLFVEALMLSAVAAALGLSLVTAGLAQIRSALNPAELAFWMRFDLSAGTVLYVFTLMVIGAALIGILPAVKATGPRVQSRLQTLSAGAGSGMELGRMWTLLIVLQVAFAVAVLPWALVKTWDLMRAGTARPGFAAEEVLTATAELADGPSPSGPIGAGSSGRFADRLAEITRRLELEPAVAAVSFAAALPGAEPKAWVEIDDGAAAAARPDAPAGAMAHGGSAGHEVRRNHVAANVFDVFGIPITTGRSFNTGDAASASTAVIVNRTFARNMFGDATAIGRRVRYVQRGPQPSGNGERDGWYEIVGVVGDFPASSSEQITAAARIYHATLPAQLHPAVIAIRMRGASSEGLARRLREVSADVDANIQMHRISVMAAVLRREQGSMRMLAAAVGAVTLSVIVLSAAGIYAMMAFTVAQRRREIGIRAALGADARRLLGSIFSRATVQLAAGAVLGLAVATSLDMLTGGEFMQGRAAAILPLVALLMTAVGGCAAFVPARRSLAVSPIETLRDQR